LRHIPDAPPTSQLNESTAFRLAEGIRLYYSCPDRPTLIMAGGRESSGGESMAAFARSLDVPPHNVLALSNSLDTHDNAAEVKSIIQKDPFILVTSAYHMPRSVKIFRLLGMRPIPAPADFRWLPEYYVFAFIPSGTNLENMEKAVHEYLGLTYLRLFPARAGK
jgi:uncharacterized SAM-binding protein YcdF (DUF218 family)